jgi:uncharacterized Ntn-hydrolase superfamily protein
MYERSAALIVHEAESNALIDVRVDLHEDAVRELRRIYDAYAPYIPLYDHQRVKEPNNAPPQEEWERRKRLRSC